MDRRLRAFQKYYVNASSFPVRSQTTTKLTERYSSTASATGLQLTEKLGLEGLMTLLHVLEKVPRPSKLKEGVAVATEQLENLIPPERRKTLKIKSAVRIGKPYREIIQLAQEAQTDLVSMGVRGRGALDLAVFGSTTYRVMQLGPCPVLTTHV